MPRRKIVIVGAGIAGLAAAHRFSELCGGPDRLEIVLLEAAPRAGGLIRSESRDGFLVERGPDSFITDKPWGLELCRRLGLESELIGTNSEHRRSFIAWSGRLVPIPDGFQVLAPGRLLPMVRTPLLSGRGKLRAALEPFVPRRRDPGDESIGSFVRRRLGNEVLERLVQPLVTGIYGADPDDLSIEATLPRFVEMECRSGSLARGIRRRSRSGEREGVSGARYGLFVSFRLGMQTLADTLSARLPAGCLRTSVRATRLRRATDSEGTASRWEILTGDQQRFPADGLLLAVPARTAAGLLEDLDADLAGWLSRIPFASAATTNLAFRRCDVPHALDGFGFVVPAAPGGSVLGCTFSSVKFAGRAPEGSVLLRTFHGGACAEAGPESLTADARAVLAETLGIRAEPLWTVTQSSPASMPRYRTGHLALVQEIETALQRHPGLQLAGNSYRGVGIPDAVRSGEAAAEQLVDSLGFAPA